MTQFLPPSITEGGLLLPENYEYFVNFQKACQILPHFQRVHSREGELP